jgi:hypothetical protein
LEVDEGEGNQLIELPNAKQTPATQSTHRDWQNALEAFITHIIECNNEYYLISAKVFTAVLRQQAAAKADLVAEKCHRAWPWEGYAQQVWWKTVARPKTKWEEEGESYDREVEVEEGQGDGARDSADIGEEEEAGTQEEHTQDRDEEDEDKGSEEEEHERLHFKETLDDDFEVSATLATYQLHECQTFHTLLVSVLFPNNCHRVTL